MDDRDQARKEQYRRVRTDFDELETEDKVVFLLEAAVSTVARGIDQFGRAVSDELNRAFHRRAEKKQAKEEGAPTPGTPGPDDHNGTTQPGDTTEDVL